MGVGLLALVALAATMAAAASAEAPGARGVYSGLDSEIRGTGAPRLRSGARKVDRLPIQPGLTASRYATSWGEELGSAGWSVLFGLVLVCVTPYVLYSNEAAHVKRGSMFSLAERATKTVDPSRPAPADDGLLVAFSGPVGGGDTLVDTLVSAVAVADALLLQRKVEILQWVEKSSSKSTDNLGGGHSTKTTYRAELEWCAAPKPEGQLKHLPEYANTTGNFSVLSAPPDRMLKRARRPNLGVFHLPAEFIDEVFLGIGVGVRDVLLAASAGDAWVPIAPPPTPPGGLKTNTKASTANSGVPLAPANDLYLVDGTEPGACRVSWRCVYAGDELSVVAEAVAGARAGIRSSDSLGEKSPLLRTAAAAASRHGNGRWTIRKADIYSPSFCSNRPGRVLGSLWLHATGAKTAAEVFDSAKHAEDTCTWIVRVVGFAMLLMGSTLVLEPVRVAVKLLPFLGSIASVSIFLVSCVFATVCCSGVTGAAYILVRPVLGVLILAVAGTVAFGVGCLAEKNNAP